MTEILLTILYKELYLPKELKGQLSKCLGIGLPTCSVEHPIKLKITKLNKNI